MWVFYPITECRLYFVEEKNINWSSLLLIFHGKWSEMLLIIICHCHWIFALLLLNYWMFFRKIFLIKFIIWCQMLVCAHTIQFVCLSWHQACCFYLTSIWCTCYLVLNSWSRKEHGWTHFRHCMGYWLRVILKKLISIQLKLWAFLYLTQILFGNYISYF